LVGRRAELAGEIKLLEEERPEQPRSGVPRADATIRIIDPASEPDGVVPKVRRPRRDRFGDGEPLRLVERQVGAVMRRRKAGLGGRVAQGPLALG
jgi:hypothetical protein